MRVYKGIVKGNEIITNRDSVRNVRMLKVEITEPEDIQQVEQILFAGEDNVPTNESEVVILEISESYKVAFAVDDLIEPELSNKGDRKIYSSLDGVIKAFIHLKNNGDIDINNGTKGAARLDDAIKSTSVEDAAFWAWAVRYNAFNAAWVVALNTLISAGGNSAAVVAYATSLVGLLGTLSTIPATLTGKIIESSDTVLVGD